MLSAALRAALEQAVGRATGKPFVVDAAEPVGGGCIHTAAAVTGGGERYFVKLNAAPMLSMFEAETDGLAALAQCGALRVPQPVACGAAADQAFLVLEHLALAPVADRDAAVRFARALAMLHRCSGEGFGWRRDNFIGATPQSNTMHAAWPFFFAHERIEPQIALAAQRGAERNLVARGEKLVERLAGLFVDHRPAPSLLHGDLWHGNAAALADGTPVLFDPAVYYGDREADLAMSELFGGFPDAFYAAYREAWPLADGYEQRKTLYNLYHILNHFNLFGSGYLRQAGRMIDTLLAQLRG